MVILLTGTTHVGKTYLADYIMKKYHINYFSLDLLKMSFYLTKNTLLTPEDRNDYWTNFLWPYVEQMIHVSIENKFDLVIEGCYIPYDYKKYFNEYELSKIKFLSILFTAEYLEKYFDDVCLYENIIEKRKVKNDISIEGIKRCCGFLYQEVINNEVPCFLYKEKGDFDRLIKEVDILVNNALIEQMGIRFLDCNVEIDGVYDFMSHIWHKCYKPIIPREQIDLLLDSYFQVEPLLSYQTKGMKYQWIYRFDNKIGLLAYYNLDEYVFIDKLYLIEQERGKNIASFVYQILINQYNKPLKLVCNQKNFSAISSYIKNGFHIVEESVMDLGHGLKNIDYVFLKKI